MTMISHEGVGRPQTPGHFSDGIETHERRPSVRDVETLGGQHLKYATFYDGERGFEEITEEVIARRIRRYVQSGIWDSDNVTDPVRGDDIEFSVMGETLEEPEASLRKWHTHGEWEKVKALFSIEKCREAGTLDDGAEAYIRELAEQHYEIVEITSLFSQGGRDVTDALFGQAIADSIQRDEVWFMGVVAPLYRDLRHNYGEKIIEKVGSGTPVDDKLASRRVRITPVVVQPRELPARMLNEIDEALAIGDEELARRRETKLRAIIEQFEFDLNEFFPPEIAVRIQELKDMKTHNPYEAQEDWGKVEAERLKSMDALQAYVAKKDMTPIVEEFKGGTLLDIGAGTGTTISELGQSQDMAYIALDVNLAILNQRPDDEIKLQASSTEIPLADGSIDVTYSKAVTAWNREPQLAIAEQLRVTKAGGIAVFTEFDWSEAGTGEHSSSTESDHLEQLKKVMVDILQKSGFRPHYGKKLGNDVAAVIAEKGIDCHQEETVHEFPEGDHRELLLGAANGLANLAEMKGIMSDEDITSLQETIQAIDVLPSASFVVPRLITQKVRLSA